MCWRFLCCYLHSFQNCGIFEAVRCLWRWFISPLLLKALSRKAGHSGPFPVRFGVSPRMKTAQHLWTTYASVWLPSEQKDHLLWRAGDAPNAVQEEVGVLCYWECWWLTGSLLSMSSLSNFLQHCFQASRTRSVLVQELAISVFMPWNNMKKSRLNI